MNVSSAIRTHFETDINYFSKTQQIPAHPVLNRESTIDNSAQSFSAQQMDNMYFYRTIRFDSP